MVNSGKRHFKRLRSGKKKIVSLIHSLSLTFTHDRKFYAGGAQQVEPTANYWSPEMASCDRMLSMITQAKFASSDQATYFALYLIVITCASAQTKLLIFLGMSTKTNRKLLNPKLLSRIVSTAVERQLTSCEQTTNVGGLYVSVIFTA